LTGSDCRFSPSRVPVGQFFPDLVRFGASMVDVEEISRHESQMLPAMCPVPDIARFLSDHGASFTLTLRHHGAARLKINGGLI